MYFKTAWRNLLRHKSYAAINIAGLAVALAASLVIFLVLQFETSYDSFHPNKENIYEVVTKDADADGESYTVGLPFPSIKFLRQDYPQVVFAQLMNVNGTQVTATDATGSAIGKKFNEETGMMYTEPELLKIFHVKWISGNEDVLKDPNSVVMSKSTAEKYFGTAGDAAGKFVKFDNGNYTVKVAGIFEDMPANSDFPFKVLASYKGFEAHNANDWPLEDWGANTSNHQVYAMVPKGFNTATFNTYLTAFEKKYNTANKDTKRMHMLQPLSDVHFDERFSNNGDHITSKTSLYTLAFIGLLILLMACINFINISTALSVTRSKEVGVRKVMGSSRAQLRWQVMAETAIVVTAASVFAILITWLALPYIKYITVVEAPLSILNGGSVLFIATAVVVVTVLAGLYPAFMLSRFKPVEAIKNKINSAKAGGISLRRALVVIQFTFSQLLIIATIVVISQMNYIKTADLGYNKEAILLVSGNNDSASLSKYASFKNELLARNDVKSVAMSFDAPSSENSWQSNFAFDKMEDRDFGLTLKFGDKDYLKTYNLQMLAGNFYDNSDTAKGYVVNETFVKKAGLKKPQEAVGKMLRIGGQQPKPVIGVVKDFKLQSLREEVPPIALFPSKRWMATTGIKLSSTNLGHSRDEIKTIWDKYFPEYVYNNAFLDENINAFYRQEDRLSLLYRVCALLAVFISCLGLYGLISFMVVQKTKEVGIRKTLGAGVGSIVYLFSKEFTVLITVAFIISAPVAWYFMNQWLQNFQYRVQIGLVVFAAAIFVSIAIAWITVGYKAVKAAMANPVKSLRTE